MSNGVFVHDPEAHDAAVLGVRVELLRAALQGQAAVFSRIDYLLGEPNEMECSDYVVHCDEQAVLRKVERLVKHLDNIAPRWREFVPKED